MSEDQEIFVEIDHNHPISWRINTTIPPTSLAFVSTFEPKTLKSTKGIEVTKYARKDGKWLQKFDLIDKRQSGTFSVFCRDMVETTRSVNLKDGPVAVATQYNKWKDLFGQTYNRLELSRIQGLFGEIIVLRDILIPRYGEEIAIRSWTGPYDGKQDFQCPDQWYEVKTISEGKKTVKISSLDQLDRDDKGRLAVVSVRNNAGSSATGLTINDVYYEMIRKLSAWSGCLFQSALDSVGYSNLDEYDEYRFELLNITEYSIEEGFPRLRRSKIDRGLQDAIYEINIDMVHNYLVR